MIEKVEATVRSYILSASGPLVDGLIFAALVAAGVQLGVAHMASFAVAAGLNYFLNTRVAVSAAGRSRDPRLYGHLLAVNLLAVFLRGGVLALLTTVWGFPAQVSIVFAIVASTLLTRAGEALCLRTGAWQLGSGARWRGIAIALAACAFLLRLVYIAQVELLPEETYYWNYSRHLDSGYLDHPPMVAWLIWLGTHLCGNSQFGVRLGAMCCAGVASVFAYRLTRNLFDEASALVALVLLQVLPFFFFAGILITPDAPLTAAWVASLYYLERALIGGRPAAWWGAGVCLGLGLLSKYTIGMLVPAMLIFMLVDSQARRWLAHWRPYAAAVLALAIFSPVIIWNAHHEWASFAFQTARRLAEAPRFSLHKLFASVLVILTPAGVLSVASALRGNAVVPAGAGGVATDPRRWRFMQLAVLVPLAVFVAFSLRHDVKFDWTGTLWSAAVPALAFGLVSSGEHLKGTLAWARRAWAPTLVILLLLYGAFFHYLVLGLPGVGYSRQMELVPVGWRSLGEQLAGIEAELRRKTGVEPLIVGMDRYMIASELAFYAPDRARSVSNTTSSHLFGDNALMYELWFPPGLQAGRTLLLVAFKPEDITGARIEARVQRLDPVQTGVLLRGGRLVRRYYYRVAYGYRYVPAPATTVTAPAEEPVLNVYNWFDYIKPEVVHDFTAQYGVTVHYDVFDSNNTLETKLLAGHSGYDVVFPSGAYLERLIPAGVFRRLDKAQLPNLANLDPAIMRRLAVADPDNAHAVVYTWGITGFAYDAAKIQARLPAAPVTSWSMLFDPKIAARLADCGIGLYESPNVIFPSVLAWLGEQPNSEDPRSLQRAQDALMAVRPYIRKISAGSLVDDLASGELCVIIASNGDAMQAQERTRIAGNGEQVRYTIPREGAVMWFDVAAIPADAPHPGNAHRFINFLMAAQVAAANTNSIRFPNGNAAAQPGVQPELRNAAIFPDQELAARLIPERPKSEAYVRLRTRAWTRFRTGR